MTKRILLGGVLGGIALFLWSSITHMVLPLGEVGVQQMQNEEPVLTAMRSSIQAPGFYFFPGMDRSPGMTAEQQEAATQEWQTKYNTGPWGILIYHPPGTSSSFPVQLTRELLTNIVSALLAAFLLSRALGGLSSFGMRVAFVALLGLFASVAGDIPYWNWYGFPTNYTLAQLTDQVSGFAVVGLVLGGIVKKPAA